MHKYANLVELEKCCRTHIFLQNFVLIQQRTSPPKICKNFANLGAGAGVGHLGHEGRDERLRLLRVPEALQRVEPVADRLRVRRLTCGCFFPPLLLFSGSPADVSLEMFLKFEVNVA